MIAKLLAVVLCLTGVLPQRVCRCVPDAISCAAVACPEVLPVKPIRCPACAHRGHEDKRTAVKQPTSSPGHRHERHQHHCPCARAKPALEATLASPVFAPAPDGSFALADFVEAVTTDTRPSPTFLPTGGPPPHVPLFLSLLVLRN